MLSALTDSLAFALDSGYVLAESDSDGNALPFLLFLSGFVFYGYVFLRYRNADKRHRHEKETEAEIHNVLARDDFVHTLKGLSNSKMNGHNHTNVTGSLNQPFGGVGGAVKKFLQ